MAFNNEYPYVDPYRYNYDWLLNEMQMTQDTVEELKNQLKNDFRALMIEFFNDIMPNVAYDDTNERIILSFENIVADAVHYYDESTSTMVVDKATSTLAVDKATSTLAVDKEV